MKDKLDFLATGLSSLCCIVPLVLLGVGLGGTILPTLLGNYKVPFMTAAIAALGLAWFLYARDRKRCAAEGCALVGSKMRLWLLGGNTALIAIFMVLSFSPLGAAAGTLFFPQPDLQALAGESVTPTSNQLAEEKSGALPFTAAISDAMNAEGVEPKEDGAPIPWTETVELKRIALHVDGMT